MFAEVPNTAWVEGVGLVVLNCKPVLVVVVGFAVPNTIPVVPNAGGFVAAEPKPGAVALVLGVLNEKPPGFVEPKLKPSVLPEANEIGV